MQPLPAGNRPGAVFAPCEFFAPTALRAFGAFLALAVLLKSALPAAAQTRAGDIVIESRRLPVAGGDSVAADVGRLYVPENRSTPDSRLIELAFVRVNSTAASPGPPLFFLAGGPGGSATAQVEGGVSGRWSWHLEIGDLVFLDQRGTGKSKPNLLYIHRGPYPTDVLLSQERAREAFLRPAQDGAMYFRGEGVDLDGYTTVESADDIDALRQALGYERINLWGFSYGTHLGLATIRRHGARVERAILMGVEGPGHTYKLPSTMDTQWRKIVALAARDPEVNEHIPDLDALLRRVIAKLDREPMVVQVRDPMGRPLEIAVAGFGLRLIMRFDIGDMSDVPVFPRLLHSIDQGDPTLLQWFVQKRVQLAAGSQLMTVVMDAASGASPGRLARIEAETAGSLFADVVNFPFPEIGAAVGAPDLGPEYRSPIVSDVNTLFLSGTMDFNTPPYQAEEVRWGFTSSAHIIVDGAGHEQVIDQRPVQQAINAFLRGEEVTDARVDAGPLRFVPIVGYDPEITHPSVPRP